MTFSYSNKSNKKAIIGQGLTSIKRMFTKKSYKLSQEMKGELIPRMKYTCFLMPYLQVSIFLQSSGDMIHSNIYITSSVPDHVGDHCLNLHDFNFLIQTV